MHICTGVANPKDDIDWPGSVVAPGRTNPISVAGVHPQTQEPLSKQIVYAPAFYSPSVFPKPYFFSQSDVVSNAFVEIPNSDSGNATLRTNIERVMNQAFFGGASDASPEIPLLLGAFGGIFDPVVDRSAAYTASRSLEAIVDLVGAKTNGGFFMSLNPDFGYRFNAIYYPEDRRTTFGLVSENYTSIHPDLTLVLRKLGGSGPLPCFDP